MASHKLKQQEWVLQEPASDPLCICNGCQLGVFVGPLNSRSGRMSVSLACSQLLGCHAYPRYETTFALSYKILFGIVWLISLGGWLFFFLRRNRGRVDLGVQKVAGQEQIEGILVRMYCITEESIFNFKTDYNFKYSMKANGFISSTYKLMN